MSYIELKLLSRVENIKCCPCKSATFSTIQKILEILKTRNLSQKRISAKFSKFLELDMLYTVFRCVEDNAFG